MTAQGTSETPADVASLHERLFTLDTHIDTPTASLPKPFWNFGAAHESAVDGSQCDLPRMRAGGIDALVFAVYVGQASRTAEGLAVAHDLAEGYIERTHTVLREQSSECGLAVTAADGPRLKAEGRRAIYLGIENAYSLGRDLANVEKFFREGVRFLGLTHMLNNDVADSSTDPRGAEWRGVSPLGREMIAECNRLGMVLDASHSSDEALRDLLAYSRTPILLTHTDCRALCDHPRNVGDDLLRALAGQGGVIQMNALAVTLVDAPDNRRTAAIMELLMRFKDLPLTPENMADADREYERACAENPNPSVSLDDFIRHLEHAVEIAGIDHVGIGCDFDGGGGGFEGLRDVRDYPNITRALVERGWREPDLAKIWGGNTLRVLRAVERAAGKV